MCAQRDPFRGCSPPGGAALAGPTGPTVTGWTVGRIRRSRHPALCGFDGGNVLPEHYRLSPASNSLTSPAQSGGYHPRRTSR
ncbi:hypothetical protein GEO37_29470 [Klebsiella pneumoniae]|nr:hypothetical protein [Klebsiella pneumoniae]